MIAAPDLSSGTFRVWQRNRDTFLRLWKTESWPPFIEAIFALVAFGFGLGAYVALKDQNYIVFLAPGLVAQAILFTSAFETTFGSYIRMELQRTFDAMVATPVSIDDVIMGEILWAATRSAFSAVAILLALLAFGLLQSWWSVAILPAAFLAAVVYGSMGMSFTAIAPSINAFNFFISLWVTPNLFFGGVFFPLEGLPEPLRIAAWFLPTTHVATIFRSLNYGTIDWAMAGDFLWLIVTGTFFTLLSLRLMRRRLIK